MTIQTHIRHSHNIKYLNVKTFGEYLFYDKRYYTFDKLLQT